MKKLFLVPSSQIFFFLELCAFLTTWFSQMYQSPCEVQICVHLHLVPLQPKAMIWITFCCNWFKFSYCIVISADMIYILLRSCFPLKIGQVCRPCLKGIRFGLWDSVLELGRGYDYIMGLLIFTPIVILSWFPFVSEFQTRLLFNQAFSRGLQISMILAGKKDKEDELRAAEKNRTGVAAEKKDKVSGTSSWNF